MKKGLVILLSLSLLGLTSCKKKEKDPTANQTPGNSNSFTLKKDGVPYTPGEILITSPETNSNYIGIQANISHFQPNVHTYAMSLSKDVQAGIYNEDNSPVSLQSICAFIHIYNEMQAFIMEDGEITVLSNDTVAKKIEFNFKFELLEDLGTGIVHITEGHAKISY